MDTLICVAMIIGVLAWTVWWAVGVARKIRRFRTGGAR